MEAALLQARVAGLQTLETMHVAVAQAIASTEAAQFGSQRVAKEQIGRIIGPQACAMSSLCVMQLLRIFPITGLDHQGLGGNHGRLHLCAGFNQ